MAHPLLMKEQSVKIPCYLPTDLVAGKPHSDLYSRLATLLEESRIHSARPGSLHLQRALRFDVNSPFCKASLICSKFRTDPE